MLYTSLNKSEVCGRRLGKNLVKIVTILGARPQFIKASVVSAALKKRRQDIDEIVVHTGQHFDANMSDVFFSELGMDPPVHSLDIHGGSHGEMTGRMLIELEKVIQVEKPDIVLVYGDTNSTLAGALAAAKLHIPIAHVEAGLRSFNPRMPEEINRILTDRLSNWLFAPTDDAVRHLRCEGVPVDRIFNVGDVMYDVALQHGARASRASSGALEELGLPVKDYVLVTVHRAENTDNPVRLRAIVGALIKVGSKMPVVWPLHPRTKRVLIQLGLLQQLEASIHLIAPLGYMDMVRAELNASVIATDSGGVQKEAFFHGVPCVTLRDETEWTELIESGWNELVPPLDSDVIASALFAARSRSGTQIRPYGNGDAADTIVSHLLTNAA